MSLSFLLVNICISLLIVFILKKYSKKMLPSERCSHETPTTTGGGIIFVGLFFLNYFFFFDNKLYFPPLLILMIIGLAIVGFIDDFYYLSYKIRLLVQVLLAVTFIQAGYVVELPLFTQNFLFGFDFILTFFLTIGLINACNFFDGLNGLLSGCVLLTISFSLFFLNTQPIIILGMIIPLVIFYLFNFPKAKIFMGDIGSTFLGFFLALLALTNQKTYLFENNTAIIHKAVIYTLTPMMFAWFDILLTLLKRIIQGRHLFSPWKDYPFHALLELGYSHPQISIFYYGTVIFMSFLTYSTMVGWIPFLVAFAIYCIVQIFYTTWLLKKHHLHVRIKNLASINKI